MKEGIRENCVREGTWFVGASDRRIIQSGRNHQNTGFQEWGAAGYGSISSSHNGTTVLEHVPKIQDVFCMLGILNALGADCRMEENRLVISAVSLSGAKKLNL